MLALKITRGNNSTILCNYKVESYHSCPLCSILMRFIQLWRCKMVSHWQVLLQNYNKVLIHCTFLHPNLYTCTYIYQPCYAPDRYIWLHMHTLPSHWIKENTETSYIDFKVAIWTPSVRQYNCINNTVGSLICFNRNVYIYHLARQITELNTIYLILFNMKLLEV